MHLHQELNTICYLMKPLYILLFALSLTNSLAAQTLLQKAYGNPQQDYNIWAFGTLRCFEMNIESMLIDSSAVSSKSKLTHEDLKKTGDNIRKKNFKSLMDITHLYLPHQTSPGDSYIEFTYIDIRKPSNEVTYLYQVVITFDDTELLMDQPKIKDIQVREGKQITPYNKMEVVEAINHRERMVEPPPVHYK